jgi:hypothetical protein
MEGFSTPTKTKAAAITIAAALRATEDGQCDEQSRAQPIAISLPWETWNGREKTAFVVPNALSEEECARIIANCESKGFEQALLNVGGGEQILATDFRKSGRCIVDDVGAAELLYERLKHVLPGSYTDYPYRGDGIAYKCVGLNERFRVLKYVPGDYFAPHRDGCFVRPSGGEWGAVQTVFGEPGDISFYTLMLYLNTPKKGGGTNFLSGLGDIKRYNPSTGQALVFDHDIRHEGELLEDGVKYAIRTDVMYRCCSKMDGEQ